MLYTQHYMGTSCSVYQCIKGKKIHTIIQFFFASFQWNYHCDRNPHSQRCTHTHKLWPLLVKALERIPTAICAFITLFFLWCYRHFMPHKEQGIAFSFCVPNWKLYPNHEREDIPETIIINNCWSKYSC